VVKKEDDGEEQVGYGKPPRRTQFKKGQSGNPKGRPKGARSAATLLKEKLCECIEVREKGRVKQISKLDAIITQMVNRAVLGEHRARGFLFYIPWLFKDLTKLRESDPQARAEAWEVVQKLVRGDLGIEYSASTTTPAKQNEAELSELSNVPEQAMDDSHSLDDNSQRPLRRRKRG
jgi:Family of unknown function (DUF5681)